MTPDKWAMLAIALFGVILSSVAQVIVAAKRSGADAQTMKQQSEQLEDHSGILKDHGDRIGNHGERISKIEGRLDPAQRRL